MRSYSGIGFWVYSALVTSTIVFFGGARGGKSSTEFGPGLRATLLQIVPASRKQNRAAIFPVLSLSVTVTLPLLQVPTATDMQASPLHWKATAICGAAAKAIIVANAKPSLGVMVSSAAGTQSGHCALVLR